MNDLCAAAVVMRSGFGEVESNLEKTEKFVKEAAGSGADVVCFPELSITGYGLREDIGGFAEHIPGPITDELAGMARENGVLVLAGLAERTEGGGVAITHAAVYPSGDVAKYRKLHLSPGEQEIFEAGREIPVFGIGHTRFGMQLCYDAHFPELSTALALKGAEVLFMSHASPAPESFEEKRRRWLRYLSTRAYDNSVFVVACNQTGDGGAGIGFTGLALAFDPRGETIAEASNDEERMIIAQLRPEALEARRNTRMGFFLSQRRPELYGELTVPPSGDSPGPGGKVDSLEQEAPGAGSTQAASNS